MRAKMAMKLAALVSLSLTLACGDGLSSEDAAVECDAIRAAEDCVNDSSYAQCLACMEECGDSCGVVNTACPTLFVCPAD